MAKEKELFTIAEDSFERDIISVDEMDPQEDEGFKILEKGKNDDIEKNPKLFIVFLDNEYNRIPKPLECRGLSFIERTLAQWKKLDEKISKVLREDYNGEIDIQKLDKMRTFIESYIDQLEDMLEGLKELKRNRKHLKRRRRAENEDGLTKEATTPHFNGFQMVITPFQRAIAGALINGKVSGGRNIEELWQDAKKKYNMNDREELEIVQILADMGYPEFIDRLRIGEESNDPTRNKDYGEWQSTYYA